MYSLSITDIKHWYMADYTLGTGDTHAIPAFKDFTECYSCVII